MTLLRHFPYPYGSAEGIPNVVGHLGSAKLAAASTLSCYFLRFGLIVELAMNKVTMDAHVFVHIQ